MKGGMIILRPNTKTIFKSIISTQFWVIIITFYHLFKKTKIFIDEAKDDACIAKNTIGKYNTQIFFGFCFSFVTAHYRICAAWLWSP